MEEVGIDGEQEFDMFYARFSTTTKSNLPAVVGHEFGERQMLFVCLLACLLFFYLSFPLLCFLFELQFGPDMRVW